MRSIRIVTSGGAEGIIEEQADGSFVVYRRIARLDLEGLMEAMAGERVQPEVRRKLVEWIEMGVARQAGWRVN